VTQSQPDTKPRWMHKPDVRHNPNIYLNIYTTGFRRKLRRIFLDVCSNGVKVKVKTLFSLVLHKSLVSFAFFGSWCRKL